MKCPGCGREVRTGACCSECAKKAAPDDIKVEYKDFKGAELLDIQMPGPRPTPAKERREPLPKAAAEPGPAAPDKVKRPARRALLAGLAAVIALLVCYLLLRLFFR